MAGYVNVLRLSSTQGTVNVGSTYLSAFLGFLTYAKCHSRILEADAQFNVKEDFLLSESIRYVSLAEYSDSTVSEIAELLHDIQDPDHPFWWDGSRFYDQYHYNFDCLQGADTDPVAHGRKVALLAAFKEVEDLIWQRLDGTLAAKAEGGPGIRITGLPECLSDIAERIAKQWPND